MLLFSYFTLCKQVSLYSLYPAYYKNLNSKWPRANNRKTTVFKKEMFKFYYCIVLWVKTFPFVKNIFFFILLWHHSAITSLLPSSHAQWAWKEISSLFSSILNSQRTILCWIWEDAWVKKNELCHISLLWTESYIFPVAIHQVKQKNRMICHFLLWYV